MGSGDVDPRSTNWITLRKSGTGTKHTQGSLTYWNVKIDDATTPNTCRVDLYAKGVQTQKYNWQNGAESNGYCFSSADWNTCEVTWFFRMNGIHDSGEECTIKLHGAYHHGTHDPDASCTILQYPISSSTSATYFARELSHRDYDFIHGDVEFSGGISGGKWYGMKVISKVASDKKSCEYTIYIDKNPINSDGTLNNNWKAWKLPFDDTTGHDTGFYTKAANWGGHIEFRIDSVDSMDFALISAREIDPNGTVGGGIGGTGGGGTGSLDTLDPSNSTKTGIVSATTYLYNINFDDSNKCSTIPITGTGGTGGGGNQVPTMPSGAAFYAGGKLLSAPKIRMVFWGDKWNDGTASPSRSTVNTKMQFLLNSAYFTKLRQYLAMQPPVYASGATNGSDANPPSSMDYNASSTHTTLTHVITYCFDNGLLPKPDTDPDCIYYIIPDRSMDFTDSVAGFHTWSTYNGTRFYWAVTSQYGTTTAGRQNVITNVGVHEIVEVMTDPDANGSGVVISGADAHLIDSSFSTSITEELADVCGDGDNNQFYGTTDIWVQGYWSNIDATSKYVGGCIIPLTVYSP